MNWVFMFLILVINSGFVICSEINTENVSEKKPYETQRAQCTVTAGEVKASAEAVVSKTLEGVCGSDEMKVAFRNLELKITQELEMIKDLIKNLQSGNTPVKVAATSKPNDREELNSNLLKINTPTLKPLNAISPHYAEKNVNGAKTESNDKPKKPTVGQPILKTLPVDHSSRKIKSSRDMEIDKLNNTLLSGSETKLFAYYWKLDKFTQKLKSNISIDHSPVFSILGKRLRLKALFNHLKRNFLYLMVENANNVHDEFQSIFLETGNIFKPLQTKFEFKHKIAVLEQNTRTNLDLESQEFIGIESGFSIPNSALLTNSYLKNDTILVKLIVYL